MVEATYHGRMAANKKAGAPRTEQPAVDSRRPLRSRDGGANSDVSRVDALLISEFDQAWSHYRHLESLRSQYLGFFFAVTTAAAAVPSLQTPAFNEVRTVLAGGAFLSVYGFLTAFLYFGIKKANVVMNQYAEVIQYVRTYIFGDSSVHSSALKRIRESEHPLFRSSLFSIQSGAERVLLFFGLLAAIGQIVLVVRTNQLPHSSGQLGAVIVMALLTVGLVTWGAWSGQRKDHPPDPSDSGAYVRPGNGEA